MNLSQARKEKKRRKKEKNQRKTANQRRVQQRSLNKIWNKSLKKYNRLNQFLTGEDPKTLWTEADRNSLALFLSERIDDFRKKRGVRHQIDDTLIMVLYATLCGKKTYREIATWLKLREDEFTVLLGLCHGVPSEDTIGRIMKRISFEQLHEAFVEWFKSYIPIFEQIISGDLKLHLCADGKAIRALTKKHIGEKHPPYMLNAYLYNPNLKAGLCIATLPIDHKTNEAKSLGPFLRQFALLDSIVTIDAAGAYQETINAILEAGAQAIICLKGNQGCLEKEAREEIKRAGKALKEEKQAIESFKEITGYEQKTLGRFSSYSEKDGGSHGRQEERDYLFSNDLVCINKEKWLQIQGIGSVRRIRKVGGYQGDNFIISQKSEETHYYLSTIKLDAKTFAGIVRKHWQIENRLHYLLDGPAFCEDQSRMRTGQAMQNMAVIRRFAYNLLELLFLEEEPSKRTSFNNRTVIICEDDLGMEEILFNKKSLLQHYTETSKINS